MGHRGQASRPLLRNPGGGVPRSSYLALVLTSILALASVRAQNAPTSTDFRVLDVVVTHPIFEDICSLLHLDESQRAQAEEFFAGYLAAARDLDDETYRGIVSAGFEAMRALRAELDPLHTRRGANADRREREKLREQTNRHRDDPRWEIVRALRYESNKARVVGWRKADALLEGWLYEFQISMEIEDDLFARVPRLIRRRVLEPAWPQSSYADFKRPVDVLALVEQASRPGGEMFPLAALEHTSKEPERVGEASWSEAQGNLTGILIQYEIQLDGLLHQRSRERRARLRRDTPLSTTSEDPGWRELERTMSQEWYRRYQVSHQAVEAIAILLNEYVSAEAATNWRDRFHRALCPELTQDRWVDDMISWLESRADHRPEQMQLTETLYADYVVRRRELISQAIRTGVRVRKEHLGVSGTDPLHLKYARRLLDLHRLSRRVIRQLQSVLDVEQTEALAQILEWPDRTKTHLLGSWISRVQLEAIGAASEYEAPVFRTHRVRNERE